MTSTLDMPSVRSVVRLCALEDIPPGLGRAFHVAGRDIAVFRTRSGRVHAMENRCPHRGGPLAEGMLAGSRVVCPLHGYRFELASGQCDDEGTCGVQVFDVDVKDGTVLLQLVHLG